MHRLSFARRCASALAFLGLLAGCSDLGGSNPASSTPATATFASAPKLSIRGSGKNDFVYVGWEFSTDMTDLTVYRGNPLRRTGGSTQYARGLATDASGKLYVAGDDAVSIFAPGAKK